MDLNKFRYSHPRYRLQYQPRRLPGDDLVRLEPVNGNDKWATVAENLTATQAVARLMGTGALDGSKQRRISEIHAKRGTSMPVMDDMYFYRIVPVDPFHMIVEDEEVAA